MLKSECFAWLYLSGYFTILELFIRTSEVCLYFRFPTSQILKIGDDLSIWEYFIVSLHMPTTMSQCYFLPYFMYKYLLYNVYYIILYTI